MRGKWDFVALLHKKRHLNNIYMKTFKTSCALTAYLILLLKAYIIKSLFREQRKYTKLESQGVPSRGFL